MKHFTCLLIILSALVAIPPQLANADEWHQWRGKDRAGVWNETGILDKFESEQIPLRWRVPIGSGYSGPSVADGHVYVTDRLTKPKQVERVHCFDWQTGESIWSYTYDCVYKIDYTAGPRATVTVHEGLAYALGAMGHLHCFDAFTGDIVWKRDLNTEYNINMPIWGIASAPIIEGENLIVQIGGKPNACIVAFDKETGAEKWKALDDNASYSAPIVITQAGKRVLVCWTGANVAGLNPQTGEVYWLYPFPPESFEIAIATPIFDQNELFVTEFRQGSLLLKVSQDTLAVELGWHRKGKMNRIPMPFRRQWQPRCGLGITFTVLIVMANFAVWMPKTEIGFGKTSPLCGKHAGAISISSNTPHHRITRSGCSMNTANFSLQNSLPKD